ncbi:MAG: hypothetical protein AAB955_03250 [Patescibacteria group bacterium]
MAQRLEEYPHNPDLTVGQQIELREAIDTARGKMYRAKTREQALLWGFLATFLVGVLGYHY